MQSPMFLRGGDQHTLTTTIALDMFGNVRRRAVLPAGRSEIEHHGVIHDPGTIDVVNVAARQSPLDELPEEVMVFLLGSRYCETDLLAGEAWKRFGHVPEGWARVQAICDFVHDHIEFGYPHADCTRSAAGVLAQKHGVCRDFAHLAITLCRAMNIPARYCTGYLGDIGVPRDPAPMDFSAWFEAYLDGRWYCFDARHNVPRTGRVVMARGRDATDVPIICTFGPHQLVSFEVWTDEMAVAESVAA
ncbi:transglutaminase family protein [Ancylobacter sp. Lp-2]|uniref:transglutaminase-like domain-containing protein n=1 Tax=Ancylobacter sp. Lp-2 TaxID=2881339 RepID=UPI00351D18F1